MGIWDRWVVIRNNVNFIDISKTNFCKLSSTNININFAIIALSKHILIWLKWNNWTQLQQDIFNWQGTKIRQFRGLCCREWFPEMNWHFIFCLKSVRVWQVWWTWFKSLINISSVSRKNVMQIHMPFMADLDYMKMLSSPQSRLT